VARDATARLYDVDEDTVVFTKLEQTKKYDQGTVAFRARKGKLIDLDKLHESIWATRLSGGTNSGVVTLEVTAIGEVVATQGEVTLKVSGSDSEFVLLNHADEEYAAALDELQTATRRSPIFRVSGQIDDYTGRWPDVLKEQPTNPRRILVTSFEVME
jgi:hypothetical protein